MAQATLVPARLHSVTLRRPATPNRTEYPAPSPLTPQCATSFAALLPLGITHPIPFPATRPRAAVRTGSLTAHCGFRENLALFDTRTLVRTCYLHRDLHTAPLHAPSPATLLRGAVALLPGSRRSRNASGEPTPAVHLRAAPVRLVSCNTLLSGCPLSEPPSSCLHEGEPLLPWVLRHLRRSCGSLHLARPAYQSTPTDPSARPPSRFNGVCRPEAHSHPVVELRQPAPEGPLS